MRGKGLPLAGRLKQSLPAKLILLVIIPIFLFVVLTGVYIIPSINQDIYQARREQIRELSEVGTSIVEHYYRMEQEGAMSREQAQESAMEALRSVRFGDREEDYFWINDYDHMLVMHPFTPELEGTDVADLEDPEGVFLFREAVDVVQDRGEGHIEYKWQYYDEEDRMEPKISYVIGFEPWEWVIGTGIYVEDIAPLVWSRALTIMGMIGVFALVSALLARTFANRNIVQPLMSLVHRARAIEQGQLNKDFSLEAEDEIGQVGQAFNHVAKFIENINDVVVTVDTGGNLIYVSPNIKQVLGYEAEEIIGENLLPFLHPEDRDQLSETLRDLVRSGEDAQSLAVDSFQHYRVWHRNGDWRWFATNSSLLGAAGEDPAVLSVAREVTALIEAQDLLQRERDKVADLLEFRNEMLDTAVVWINTLDTAGNVTTWNKAAEEISGYSAAEVVGHDQVWEWLYPDPEYRGEVFDKVRDIIYQGQKVDDFETQIRRKDGEYRWISWYSNNLVKDGQIVGTIAIGIDNTLRKRAEENLIYLSFHDKLTGLYNRAFLEKEMQRLDTKRQLPISVIMADLNGLKLVNDTYGHGVGDQLLKTASRTLKDSCRAEDLVGRWGGDEFVLLLPQTSLEEAQKICSRIRDATSQAYVNYIPVSLALGCAEKPTRDTPLSRVIARAEDVMYKKKLTESRSSKSAVLHALLRTLEAKSHETREHGTRMQQTALKIGEQLGLTAAELDQLGLLITLHDVGKINLPEELLRKEGPLNEEEWEQIKRHPEIGYRIARATEDFVHVADYILAHHERWDGRGYPRGLKGEEIPLLSRIAAIVDAYDVMVHGRPYKPAMSPAEIAQEFRRCAGSQFDPRLVEVFLGILEAGEHQGNS